LAQIFSTRPRRKYLLLCAVFFLSSCTVTKENDGSIDQDLALFEAAITSVDGALDSLSPSPFMNDCPLTINQECRSSGNNSGQTLNYNGCEPLAGLHYFGQVRLAFEGSNCALDIGETVLRTHTLSVQNLRGGAIQTTTNRATNYREQTVGGGTALTRTSVSNWSLEIGGVNKVFKRNNAQITSISVQTTEPVEITGMLERRLRMVNGGVVIAYDNLNQTSALYRFHNLHYEARCCHPVRGSVKIAKLDGTHAEVEFHGCGQGTMVRGIKQTAVTLTYCE
jgi:hypothetical protein